MRASREGSRFETLLDLGWGTSGQGCQILLGFGARAQIFASKLHREALYVNLLRSAGRICPRPPMDLACWAGLVQRASVAEGSLNPPEPRTRSEHGNHVSQTYMMRLRAVAARLRSVLHSGPGDATAVSLPTEEDRNFTSSAFYDPLIVLLDCSGAV